MKYEAAFGGITSELNTLIQSMQDTQLILDVNIAYEDELDAVMHQRTLVRCSLGEINEDQAQTLLRAAMGKRQDIEIRANAALRAIDLAHAELNDRALP
ncbi:hypothetical protein [Qipengyuania sp. DGS5-3]|uniref:hypothetical protein n=1 Tax=Qipengyuania sp. DGS5-3 TaxID=3349632 RepID=UPI0036D331B4